MIARTHRFHGHGSLRYVLSKGKTVRLGADCALRYSPSRRSQSRAAVVVSRKVSKSAVVRNRIRRRIYESVRNLYGSFESPYDVVFLVYDARLAELPAPELQRQITGLLQKAAIIGRQAPSRAIVKTKE